MQAAFSDFMAEPAEYLGLPAFYQQKRDFFLEAMRNTRFKPLHCSGTYFQLFEYQHLSDEADLDFCKRLVADFGVAAIPVSSFFSNGKDEKVIRLCFAKTEDILEKAAKALEKV
jgi:methionine aminotransferase